LRLPDLDGLIKGATAIRLPGRQVEAIYFDTADLRLARNGITLRYRSGEDGPPWTPDLVHTEEVTGSIPVSPTQLSGQLRSCNWPFVVQVQVQVPHPLWIAAAVDRSATSPGFLAAIE
jgi:hypothetical protein